MQEIKRHHFWLPHQLPDDITLVLIVFSCYPSHQTFHFNQFDVRDRFRLFMHAVNMLSNLLNFPLKICECASSQSTPRKSVENQYALGGILQAHSNIQEQYTTTPLLLKRMSYNQWVLAVLTLGAKIWCLTKYLERKCQSTDP